MLAYLRSGISVRLLRLERRSLLLCLLCICGGLAVLLLNLWSVCIMQVLCYSREQLLSCMVYYDEPYERSNKCCLKALPRNISDIATEASHARFLRHLSSARRAGHYS